jgi:F420-dependent oxidoreductase-like protein
MEVRVMLEPQQGASYGQQLAVAKTAEAAGFDAFFRSDHLMAFHGDGLPGPTDSWITLGAIARETLTIRLGTMVTSMTFRSPGMLAIAVAQVDQMSSGRVELGLGTGWYEEEHHTHAIPFPPIGERFERLEEQVRVLDGMWRTPVGERFSFEGRHYTVTDSPGLPKPAQSPRPPLIIGGAGHKRTPRLAARYADEYNAPFHTLEAAMLQYDHVRRACEAEGRDPSSILLSIALSTVVGGNDAEVRRRAANIGHPPELVGLAGTPAAAVENLARWADAGAGRVYLQLLDVDDLDHVRLIGEEVIPQARQL